MFHRVWWTRTGPFVHPTSLLPSFVNLVESPLLTNLSAFDLSWIEHKAELILPHQCCSKIRPITAFICYFEVLVTQTRIVCLLLPQVAV